MIRMSDCETTVMWCRLEKGRCTAFTRLDAKHTLIPADKTAICNILKVQNICCDIRKQSGIDVLYAWVTMMAIWIRITGYSKVSPPGLRARQVKMVYGSVSHSWETIKKQWISRNT